MSHTLMDGFHLGASMGQKAVTTNPRWNPAEHSRVWLRKKPVSDPSLSRACEIGLSRMDQKVRDYEGSVLNGSDPIPSVLGGKQEPNPDVKQDHGTEQPSLQLSAQGVQIWGSEQVASRMFSDGRIASEANAWGNAQDMQTEARQLGR